MTSRPRRLKPPTAVLDALATEPGERALAWATDDTGAWYVGTDRALYLPGPDEPRRLPWEQVERAEWQQDTGVLAVVEITDWGQVEKRIDIEVAEPGRLLELLQERVTKSVVSTTYTPVARRQGLTVVARRSPTGRGPVTWSYVLSKGLDPADPTVAAVAEETRLAAARELRDLV